MYSHNLIYAAWVATTFEFHQGQRPQYRVTDDSGFEMPSNAWEIGLLQAGEAVLLNGMVVERRFAGEAWEVLAL